MEVDDDKAMAAAVENLINNPEVRCRAAKMSLKKASGYSAEEMVRQYQVLATALANEKRGSLSAQPKITVIIPVYDRTVFLERAIKSVLDQSCSEWRLLIAIDTLEPNERLRQIIGSFKDARISSICVEHRNHCATMNHAIQTLRSEYVTRLDSDDILQQDAISCLLSEISEHPNVGYFYCSRMTIDEFGNPKTLDANGPVWESEEYEPYRLEEWFTSKSTHSLETHRFS